MGWGWVTIGGMCVSQWLTVVPPTSFFLQHTGAAWPAGKTRGHNPTAGELGNIDHLLLCFRFCTQDVTVALGVTYPSIKKMKVVQVGEFSCVHGESTARSWFNLISSPIQTKILSSRISAAFSS